MNKAAKEAAQKAAADATAARQEWAKSLIATTENAVAELEEWIQAFPDAAGTAEAVSGARVLKTSVLPKLRANVTAAAPSEED
jgi:hypothetical protein